MKISKLLVVVVLVFTSFINLRGVIKTVELRSQTDESLLARFEFMPVEEFEEAIGKKLQGLCFEGLGWNARDNYKICRVKFENFGTKKIKIEESLRQLFSEYGMGPFSFKSPSALMIAGPGVITAIVVCLALEIYFITLWGSVFDLRTLGGPKPTESDLTKMKVAFVGIIVTPAILLPCLCTLFLFPLLSRWKFKNSKLKFVKQFSEREEVAEDGIIFFIKNEFLEQCSEMLERMSFQVEEEEEDALCRFISQREPLQIMV